ncbi:hypothetical protein L6164_017477 [Bauhinia variegata]|uniref:Uncharacterized protein n=1 Tax=Bauhinia variegata TaxID=167791 RepID=A0ACB9N8S6_BAUVA|nr:hypothetical protein L6164_017477 [Bauhinia variegata]
MSWHVMSCNKIQEGNGPIRIEDSQCGVRSANLNKKGLVSYCSELSDSENCDNLRSKHRRKKLVQFNLSEMDAQVVDTTNSRIENQRIGSGNYNTPSSYLLQDTRESRDKYLDLCVPLYLHALNGNWPAAKEILDKDESLLTTAIAKGLPTVLHVAAGSNHVHFVEELVNLMDTNHLQLQDYKGNTAICFAATVGNFQIVDIMLQRNEDLAKIRGGNGMTPLHFAALHGRRETAWNLYQMTTEIFEPEDWNILFFTCIKTGITDLALKILEDRPLLAFERDDENKETALHILARKPSNFELVSSLWQKILRKEDSELEIRKLISTPSQLLFDAAKVGNVEFLAVLMKSCPDLIWELDNKNRSIIHIAVLHRRANIFNLIHEIGSNKDIIVTYRDTDAKNNLLHLAAKLAPSEQLELVSGAAFQMTLELLWFEEVKKIMLPPFRDMKNSEGKTPDELFIKEHAELQKNAESWMKGTANSCMVVSTLIATGVFTAAFTVPGAPFPAIQTIEYENPLQRIKFLAIDAFQIQLLTKQTLA